MNRHLLAVTFLFFNATTLAQNFGVHGPLFPVKEQNALEAFMAEVHQAEKDGRIDAANAQFKKKVLERAQRPKVMNFLLPATEYRTFLVDMSKQLERDVVYNGKVMHKKGTLINPLAHQPVKKHMVFIDGDRPEEVEYALAYALEHKSKIILYRGSPAQLAKAHNMSFYFAQDQQLINSFKIIRTPSVVYQEGLYMRVEEIPL